MKRYKLCYDRFPNFVRQNNLAAYRDSSLFCDTLVEYWQESGYVALTACITDAHGAHKAHGVRYTQTYAKLYPVS